MPFQRAAQTVEEKLSNLPEFLSTGEVADLLRVNRSCLRGLWRTGKFPPPMMFNKRLYRWSKADVAKYLVTAQQRSTETYGVALHCTPGDKHDPDAHATPLPNTLRAASLESGPHPTRPR